MPVYSETPPHVHRSTHNSSAKGALCLKYRGPRDTDKFSTVDRHGSKQEGTELVQVRVDRAVVVGVGPWKSEPSEELYPQPEVKWDRGV